MKKHLLLTAGLLATLAAPAMAGESAGYSVSRNSSAPNGDMRTDMSNTGFTVNSRTSFVERAQPGFDTRYNERVGYVAPSAPPVHMNNMNPAAGQTIIYAPVPVPTQTTTRATTYYNTNPSDFPNVPADTSTTTVIETTTR